MNLHTSSLDIVTAGQTPSGAYIASPTFSQYRYCWLRDGTWIAYSTDRVGQHASARAFYTWIGNTLEKQRPRLEQLWAKLEHNITLNETDYLPTRFTSEGELSHDDWWNFQLDGYGTWLWGLAEHVKLTGDRDLWAALEPAVELTVRYLAPLWQSTSYDCWEEHRHQIHVSTLAALYGGLRAVQQQNPALVPDNLPDKIRGFVLQTAVAPQGHLMKYLGNDAVDASLLWTAIPYGLIDVRDGRFTRTLAKIESDLLRPGGGVYRYADDVYYGGGEWILLTAWLGWVYVELGRVAEAHQLMRWIEAQATPDGALPEQVSDHQLHPAHYAEWEARWGAVASPLLWSHAMVLILESCLEGIS